MKVESMGGISVGDFVSPLIGGYRGSCCKVLSIGKDEGAQNGWFTVQLPFEYGEAMFAGEEIEKVELRLQQARRERI